MEISRRRRTTMMPRIASSLVVFLLCCLWSGWVESASSSSGTTLSGFGSRSARKTIFPLAESDDQNEENSALSTPTAIAAKVFSSRRKKLVTSSPGLWVRKSSDELWIRPENGGRTLRVGVDASTGDWTVREDDDEEEEDDEDEDWIPIEGLYGFHKLPSGIVWLLVTKTEPVYQAPLLAGNNTEDPWWEIRRAANLELVHLSRPKTTLGVPQLKEEVRQLRLLRQSLKEHTFYYVPNSETAVVRDFSRTLQVSLEEHLTNGGEAHREWWEGDQRPDPRFFWNQAAVDPILQKLDEASEEEEASLAAEVLGHVLPLTSAFVGVSRNVTHAGLSYDQVLVSRRSRFRAGTRFTRRGADAGGSVANFAETEQACLSTTPSGRLAKVSSHVQTRGSIPLRWSSPADVKTYRPRVRIGTDPLAQARALRLHLLEQFARYVQRSKDAKESDGVAKLVFVNLIDKKKDQGRLGRAFDAVLRAVTDVFAESHANREPKTAATTTTKKKKAGLYDLHSGATTNTDDDTTTDDPSAIAEELLSDPRAVEHVWFDFHAEVKDGRWDKLGGLLETLVPALDAHGGFVAGAPSASGGGWTIERTQTAVVRTNCMDCLDRTNVVQGLFGRYALFHQLVPGNATSVAAALAKEYAANPLAIPWESGEKAHRLLWADNADAISRLYAGTPALKGDFTRTGKRTKKGALDDGLNSLQRYYLNNFQDADRQEGMDLLVGYATFSNAPPLCEDDDDEEGSLTSSDDERALLSIREAARKSFFGGEPEPSPAEDNTAEETTAPPLDLRWIPGDLQGHLISHANNENGDGATENDSVFEYSSARAMAAIDRRSASDLPWWAEFGTDDSDDDDDGEDDSGRASNGLASLSSTLFGAPLPPTSTDAESESDDDESDEIDLPLTNQQRYPRIPPVQLFGLLVIGFRAPVGLATAVVGLLGVLLLPSLMVPPPPTP